VTENTQNLLLELLRSIRGDIATIKDDIRELKSRTGNVEIGVASIRRDLGQLATDDAEQQVRFDRLV
jgi:hypothetical protein